jgi:hypothetical protein
MRGSETYRVDRLCSEYDHVLSPTTKLEDRLVDACQRDGLM